MTTDAFDFQPTPYEHTAFGGFWKAINLHMHRCGLPELGFRDARRVWDAAVSEAGVIAREHERNGTQSATLPMTPDVGGMAHFAVHGRGK